MTNVTISLSISQTVRSGVAIFHLSQPMVFLSHFISQLIRYARACSSYECFILRAARLSSKLFWQEYVMERLKSSLRKFYGRYGDLIKHYELSLSQMLHDILGHDHIQWHPQLIRHYTNLRTYYRTCLYNRFWLLLPNFGGCHRTLQRVRLANRGRLLLRTPGPVQFGTCICSNVETTLSWTCHVYGPYEFRTSLGTFILLVKVVRDFLRTNAKFEPGSVTPNFCWSIWTVCTTCTISLPSKIMKVKNQYGREKIVQNNEKSSEIDNKTIP